MQLMQKSLAQGVSSCNSCRRAQHKRSAHTLFDPHTLVVKSQHASHFCFNIAKGLATCRLGGVISAQKVLF